MGGSRMDVKVAARTLVRSPAFAGFAVATLALSVGAATLLFSVVNGVLLSPLPYESPDELVAIYLTNDEWRESKNELLRRNWDTYTMSLGHIEAFRQTPGPIVGVAGYAGRVMPLDSGDGEEETAETVLVDGEIFSVLGVVPSLGRLPSPDEIREGAPVAVLRDNTWADRFRRDPDVLGRTFGLGDRTYTVIGVMPPGFFLPSEDASDLWVPVTEGERRWPSFSGVARLAPGATIAEASGFFEQVARRVGEEDPERSGLGGRAISHLEKVVGGVSGGIRLLFGTTLLVVLVACVTLGNLFLARASGRRQELAVRASLGAGMWSLTSTVLAELLLISLVGGGLGVALAASGVDPFVAALRTSLRRLPRQGAIGLDGSVLVFSLAATLTVALVAGLVSTLASRRWTTANAITDVRRSGGSDATRIGQRLVLVVQGGMTVVLVSAAALLGRSFLAAMSVDIGMRTERVAVLRVDSDRETYQEPEALARVQEAIRAAVGALPNVTAATTVWSLPGTGGVLLRPVRREDTEPDAAVQVTAVPAGEGYFATMGIPLLAGRGFRAGDGAGDRRKTVVSESLATELFGTPDVVGRRFVQSTGDELSTLEIVGVAAETRQFSVLAQPTPTVYEPMEGTGSHSFYVTMAVDGDPTTVLGAARERALAVDGTLEINQASTFDAMLRDSVRHIRLRMILMTSLAVLAGVLAMIGISGVVAHFLSEQTREVGIRMALGATPHREIGRVVLHAFLPTAMGVAMGAAVAVSVSGVMEGFVFGVEPSDPVTYLAVAIVLLATAAVAALIPASRAATVDPARVLNHED